MTPRLAVTQERAGIVDYSAHGGWPELLLRLDQRPTMPCPDTLHVHRVPIPEGTRVEVGWWEHGDDTLGCWMKWHPVAFATLTKVKPVEGYWPDDDYWLVTLSDITVEAP